MLTIRSIQVFRLAIPMRCRFEHAAAARDQADPVIVRVRGDRDGRESIGHGETLARPYVTGETAESVVSDVCGVLAPLLAGLRARSFEEVLSFLETLPFERGVPPPEGGSRRRIGAARCAVELAVLDAACRSFGRRLSDVGGRADGPEWHLPGSLEQVRYSGIVLGRTRCALGALLALQRCWGLRDYKIKVAVPGWEQRLAWAGRALGAGLRSGRLTLRADANGAWTIDQALEACGVLESAGVCALEQPLAPGDDGHLAELAARTRLDLIADESLVTLADCQRLLDQGAVRIFNIRLAKVGGLLAALRMARAVLEAGREIQLGCLVGETSLLTAAGVAFLEVCPRVRFVEGGFGRLLLRRDVTRRSLRFGPGGRMKPLTGCGLPEVDERALHELAAEPPVTITL